MGKPVVAAKAGGGSGGGGGGGGMDRGELKTHLRFAREEPIQVAFAIGGDGKAVLQLHRRKPGRALETELKKAAPDTKSHRWGTAQVDPDNPKQIRFVVNKASSGMSRKLVLALKGTGFNKVRIVLEDGTEVETHEEEDEAAQEGAETEQHSGAEQEEPAEQRSAAEQDDAAQDGDTGADTPTGMVDPEQYPEAPVQEPEAKEQEAGAPDAKALAHDLTGLVKQMLDVLKHDSSQKSALAELATDAQVSLKRGDLEQAAAGIEIFRQALDDAKQSSAAGNGTKGTTNGAAAETGKQTGPAAADGQSTQPAPNSEGHEEEPHGAKHPAAPAIAKSRGAWVATRKRIDADINKVLKEFTAAFSGHEMAGQLESSFKGRIETVLHHLDEELAHKLDEVNKSKDAAQRGKLVEDAHKLIHRYTQHVAQDDTIKALDQNPFVPLALSKTLTATLSTLAKSIR